LSEYYKKQYYILEAMHPITNKDFKLGEEVFYEGIRCRVISVSRPDGKLFLSGIGPAIPPEKIQTAKRKRR
jgi:hypothetical protein